MVCEKMDGDMASIQLSSVNACFQELLAEVEENGEGIQEIIDVLGGGSSGGGGGGPAPGPGPAAGLGPSVGGGSSVSPGPVAGPGPGPAAGPGPSVGGGSGGSSDPISVQPGDVIQSPEYPDFYTPSSNQVVSAYNYILAPPLKMLPHILLGLEPGG